MKPFDTIVAPATPAGRGALAIVRIDGPASAQLLEELSRAPRPAARLATLLRLRTRDGELLDECVAVRFAAPASFTGNDLVELTLHGNPLLARRVVEECVALGARFAEPGEFTERAVLNGKLDLVQAEAIADLIDARTTLQARLSLSNLEGHLSRTVGRIRAIFLDLIARAEARLDFSEEGYEFVGREEMTALLGQSLRELGELRETWRRGRATVVGLKAAILGRPNAGKSTLLNRLVGSDRAIVTAFPGTTRDVVRETIEIGGLPVTIADTAGLRESADPVEEIGIGRARAEARGADLVLYLVDGSEGLSLEDRQEVAGLEEAKPGSVLVVYTKADLAAPSPGELGISAVSGEGMGELLGRLDELVGERHVAPEGALMNERQRLAVEESAEGVGAALASIEAGMPEEIILVDLYRAATALGLLTGAISRNEVLSSIFSRFCIGK